MLRLPRTTGPVCPGSPGSPNRARLPRITGLAKVNRIRQGSPGSPNMAICKQIVSQRLEYYVIRFNALGKITKDNELLLTEGLMPSLSCVARIDIRRADAIIVTHTGVQHLAGKKLSQATCEDCAERMGIINCAVCHMWLCRGCKFWCRFCPDSFCEEHFLH